MVQLAAARGATVIATAKADRADFVRDLGAAEAVDYSADLPAAVRAVAPDGVDAVLHAAGDPNELVELIKPGGRIASVLGFGQDAVGDRERDRIARHVGPDGPVAREARRSRRERPI